MFGILSFVFLIVLLKKDWFILLLCKVLFMKLPLQHRDAATSTPHRHSNISQDLSSCEQDKVPYSHCLRRHPSYSTLQIADYISSLLDQESSTSATEPARAARLQLRGLNRLSWCNLNPDPATKDFDLDCPFDALSLIFFGGLLDSKDFKLQWADPEPPKSFLDVQPIAWQIGNEIHIVRPSDQYWAIGFLPILAHEMTHLVLDHYGCGACTRPDTVGWYSHGPAFQKIAEAIERSGPELVEGKKRDGNRWNLGILGKLLGGKKRNGDRWDLGKAGIQQEWLRRNYENSILQALIELASQFWTWCFDD